MFSLKTDVITDSCKYKPSVRNYYNCKYFLLCRLYLFYSLICYSKAKHTVLIHDFRQTIYPLILEKRRLRQFTYPKAWWKILRVLTCVHGSLIALNEVKRWSRYNKTSILCAASHLVHSSNDISKSRGLCANFIPEFFWNFHYHNCPFNQTYNGR